MTLDHVNGVLNPSSTDYYRQLNNIQHGFSLNKPLTFN